MPKSRVQMLKRQVAHAHIAIDRAIVHLAEVEAPFNEQHPELAEPLQQLCVGLDLIKQSLEAWVAEVWGREEVDWNSWANTPDSEKEKLDD